MANCAFEGCNKHVFVKETPHGGLCNGHYAQYKKGKELAPLREYNPRPPDPNRGTCPEPGCGRPSWHKTGLCQSHQRQAWDNKTKSDIRDYEFQIGQKCASPGCDEPAKSKGYCSQHYRSDWGKCVNDNCDKQMYNKRTGLCAGHYMKWRRMVNTSHA